MDFKTRLARAEESSNRPAFIGRGSALKGADCDAEEDSPISSCSDMKGNALREPYSEKNPSHRLRTRGSIGLVIEINSWWRFHQGRSFWGETDTFNSRTKHVAKGGIMVIARLILTLWVAGSTPVFAQEAERVWQLQNEV
jgi:hypothetical protein